MAEELKFGSVKRLGARYGTRIRDNLGKIERLQRGKHKCPYCHSLKVKRLSTGIWFCDRCKAKFTSKAYYVGVRALPGEEEKKPEKAEEKTEEKPASEKEE